MLTATQFDQHSVDLKLIIKVIAEEPDDNSRFSEQKDYFHVERFSICEGRRAYSEHYEYFAKM
jgi:hypothetical protein